MKKPRVFQWFTSLKVFFSVGFWLEGKYRKLVFYDTNEPPFDPHLILDEMFWGEPSPLIISFFGGKFSEFVRESISKDGGLGELVKEFGVRQPSSIPQCLSSWPKLLFYCYGKVENWDLFEDAKRLEVS